MTVTFNPQLEQAIAHQAGARGIAPDEFVREIVTRAIHPDQSMQPLDLSIEGFLSELARIGKDLPALPKHSYTRESFYEDLG